MSSVPAVISPKSYEHDFCVPGISEADCLLSVDFLETNKCDPLFSCPQLQLDSHSFVPFYYNQFDYGHDNIFRVISTETLSVSPGHTRIILAHITNWKQVPIQICALLEPKNKFEPNNGVSAPKLRFDFTEEVIPINIDNRTEEEVTSYKNTTLGFSEIVPEVLLNNLSKVPKSLPVPIKQNKYELNNFKKSVHKDMPKRFHDQFGSLVKEFFYFFSIQNGIWE